jgi:starch phosphorylase
MRIINEKLKLRERTRGYREQLDKKSLQHSVADKLRFSLGKDRFTVTEHDSYKACSMAIHDRLLQRWIHTSSIATSKTSSASITSLMEYLMGRALGNALINLGIYDIAAKALQEMGYDVEEIRELEWDAGLGNGGLGRLAACFLDSMATMRIPCFGYGIRYEYGIFHQHLYNGWQLEAPDNWLRYGNPWEIADPNTSTPSALAAECTSMWTTPVASSTTGWTPRTLWPWPSTHPFRAFAMIREHPAAMVGQIDPRVQPAGVQPGRLHCRGRRAQQLGDHLQGALPQRQHHAGQGAAPQAGILLRLRHPARHHAPLPRPPRVIRPAARQGRHPAERHPPGTGRGRTDAPAHGQTRRPLERAWDITTRTIAYTNHTILPEALERWSTQLMERLLPRHLQIIYEINRRFLDTVWTHYPPETPTACETCPSLPRSRKKPCRWPSWPLWAATW